MSSPIHVLGFAGSLRQGSYNRALLKVAASVVPEGMTLEIFDLKPIPLYDGDVEAAGIPAPVAEFRARIKAADALLIATPEYNYSYSGVVKNAIDWASRPPDQPLAKKPYALFGAAAGGFGTARAQYHLRQVCAGLDMLAVNKPEVMIAAAQQAFGSDGALLDPAKVEAVRGLVTALAAWTRRLRGEGV
ncbi:MAG: NADPH-dependent FMN reductase [Azospirillum sp.]|nr:NADPH-dependent FMN reductase [Azospirillum sp.]